VPLLSLVQRLAAEGEEGLERISNAQNFDMAESAYSHLLYTPTFSHFILHTSSRKMTEGLISSSWPMQTLLRSPPETPRIMWLP
jgi:hypothetical protein